MHIALLHYYLRQPNPAYAQLAAALRDRGHRVWIGAADGNFDLTWHDGETEVNRCAGPGHRTGGHDSRPQIVQDWAFISRIRESIRRHSPDIVQVNPAALPLAWAIPLGMPSAVRFVIDWRQVAAPSADSHTDRLKQGIRIRFRRAYSRYIFDRAAFLHEAGAEMFLGPEWHRWASVVPLGVGTHFLADHENDGCDQDRAKVCFLYIGSLSLVRKLDDLIEAARILKERTRNFELRLVGPDNADGHYQAEIRKLDLNDVVTIRPPIDYAEVPRVVRNADVGLAYVPNEPADWQFHPTLKVLEYRALGIPIIATDVAPNGREVVDGINGMLCANQPAAWADAMFSLVGNRNRLAALRNHARLMRRGLSWADAAAKYEHDIYLGGTLRHKRL